MNELERSKHPHGIHKCPDCGKLWGLALCHFGECGLPVFALCLSCEDAGTPQAAPQKQKVDGAWT